MMDAESNSACNHNNMEQLVQELQQLRSELAWFKSNCCRWWATFNLNEPIPLLNWIINKTPIIIFVADKRGFYRLAEGKALESLGLKPGELVGKSVFDVYADNPAILDATRRVLSGEQFTEEVVVDEHYFEVQFIPIRDADNEVSGAIALALEVTRRRRAELTLTLNEKFYQEIFEALPVAVLTANSHREVTSINPAAEQLFGYHSEKLIGSPTKLLFSDIAAYAKVGDHFRSSENLMQRLIAFRRADGSSFLSNSIFSKSIDSDGNIKSLVGIHRDIVEEQKAEELRYWHEKNLQLMIDATPVMAFMLDRNYKILFVNRKMADYFKVPLEHLIGRSAKELHGDSEVTERRCEKLHVVFDSGQPLKFVDQRGDRWFEHHLIPILTEHQIDRVAIFVQDITAELLKAEQERELIANEIRELVTEILEPNQADGIQIVDTLQGTPLTPKELVVLKEIASGLSTKQIANKLEISTKTVESHRLSIMRKLRIFNVVGLTKYALREGLAEL